MLRRIAWGLGLLAGVFAASRAAIAQNEIFMYVEPRDRKM
jgi:hypothetical protein